MHNQNPYHPLSPPDDPTLFYGRQDAIAFLRQNLVGAYHREMLVILGRMGMGKTSLLQHTAFIVDERYQTVYVETGAVGFGDETALLLHLAQCIVARMEAIGASTYRLPPFPDAAAPAAEVREWFAKDFLDVVLTAIRRDRFLLLLWDDFHLIIEAQEQGTLPEDFIAYLGAVLERHDRLGMVAALDVAYEEHALRFSPLANLNFYFRLGHLDEQAARQLILDPVEGVLSYTDDALDRLLHLCGGYPFLIHSVCRLLYRLHEADSELRIITPQIIEHVHPAVMEETGEIMGSFWKETTPNLREVLKALLEFWMQDPFTPVPLPLLQRKLRQMKVGMNQTQLVSQLRGLEYLSIVKATPEGSYGFSTALEADWLRSNWGKTLPARTFNPPSRARVVGAGAVLLAVLVVAVLLVAGVFDEDREAPPKQDAPPTSTFAVDIDATRRADRASATAQAIPSATTTPSPTPSNTATFTPPATAALTRTPRPSTTPSRTPSPQPSATPRQPSATPTRTPRSAP